MYFPKSIKIFGVDYKIKLVNHNDIFSNEQDGMLNWKEQTIYIQANYPVNQQYKILLHEIIHVISADLLLNFNEQLVEQLATSLFAILSDNKLLKE